MDLNRPVAYALRAGVIIGASLAIFGLAVWAAQGFEGSGDLSSYSFNTIIQSAATGSASGIVFLGIIILIATPIIRVTLSLIFFLVEKDAKYVGITAIVLAMLLFALLSGRIG